MAEAFGIAAGAIGIASIFRTCVDCFGFVQLSRHFGRDYQIDILALDCARLRLSRWGEAVRVYDDPKLGRANATDAEVRHAKDTLFQIIVLFAESEKISKAYRLRATTTELATSPPDGIDPLMIALHNNMKELAVRRQKQSGVLKKTRWALYHRSELKELVKSVTNLVDNVEKLFPAPPDRIESLVRQETAEIKPTKQLELVSAASDGVDGVLNAAAREALTGNRYLKVVIEGKAQTGDSFGTDWRGPGIATSNTYEDVRVASGGQALIGNKYGGKDFWDD